MMEEEGSEEQALRISQENAEGAEKVIQTKSTRAGMFLSNAKLTGIVIIVCILCISVIVLAAFLGHARHRLSQAESTKRKEGASVLPTSPSSPVPTTPGTEAWWNVRLPSDVIPVHYNVFLDINLERLRFDGNVEIFINVTQSTNVILVHSNRMNVTSVAVKNAIGGGNELIKKHFWFKKNQFYVFQLKKIIEPGSFIIKMSFEALLNRHLAGLFKGEYRKANGKITPFVASRSVPTEGRTIFPCFDEPGFKATFNITIAHPSGFIALSNMPTYKSETKNGKTYYHFMRTLRMSTYILAFVVCDFNYKEFTTKNNVSMRFYITDNLIQQTKYAPSIAGDILTFYEQYYGIKYPLPKADMIALPDFSFSAMENWGLVMYKEDSLLWIQDSSSEKDKEFTAAVVAHELTHQWFGNLVTMKWWGDLWLKEGFASFLEYKGINAVEPTWKVLDQFVLDHLYRAFLVDGLITSHPIRVKVNTPSEIRSMFDYIPYGKGSAVLRMLESFLGEDVFHGGFKRYLRRHAYGNAETDDLWRAFEQESCTSGRCVEVKKVMDTWTLQMGYPVVNIKRKNGAEFTIDQKHFLFDENVNVSHSKYTSPFNYEWIIPFTFVTSRDARNPIQQTMDTKTATISWDGSGWIKGNYEHKGYYLVNYEDSNWDALATQLRVNHTVFGIADRAGLMLDAFNLARGHQLNYKIALSLTAYMRNEIDHVLWSAMMKGINYIQGMLSSTRPAFKDLMKYLVYQAKDAYDGLGFVDTGTHREKLTREVVLNIYCKAGISSCVNNATARFRNWIKDPTRYFIPPNFHLLVYRYGIANGGVEEWDFVFRQFLKTKEATTKNAMIHGMAASKEPWILRRYLDYSLDASKVRYQDSTTVIRSVAQNNPIGRQLAWNFVRYNWGKIMQRYGNSIFTLGQLIKTVTSGFSSEYELNELIEFTNWNPYAGTGQLALKQGIERVTANIQWLKDNEKDVENWLKKFIQNHNIT